LTNDVTAQGAGFDHDTNIITLFSRDGRDLPLPDEQAEVAERILDEAVAAPRRSCAASPPRTVPGD